MPQLQPLRKHVARKRRPGESRLMTLQAPPRRTGPEAVTRGKTNHFLIQRGPSNPVNFSNLQYSLRARVTRCWSSAFRMPEVAELRSHTRQVLRGAQLCLDSDRSAGS